MTVTGLELLADRMAISDVMHRYATAIDMRDFDLLEQVFDDPVEADFSRFGGATYAGERAGWIDQVRKTVSGLTSTQHLTGNHVHRVEGDRAHLTAYLQAMHHLSGARGDPDYLIGGYYEIELARRPAGWRITRYGLTVTWQRGDRDVLRQAMRRLKG
ncbi:MAG: nuclear transport factor 2 family protein [Pseudomonadota bacterium]|nr:nuclear transport factor 2 family protein [Pseudomonadota bacterium]